MKNRGRPPTSPILPGALRLAVASLIATVACSGSLGGLGGGTGDGGAPLLPGNGSSSASVGSGVTVSSSLASSSSSGGSAASEGSSSSGSSTAAAATATTTAQSSNGSSGSSSSSSSGSSSSTNAADASVAPDARADAADAAVLSFATDVYPIIAARCIACHTPTGDGVTEGHLDMTTNGATGAYAQLVNVAGMGNVAGTSGVTCAISGLTRVVPGSHLTSILYGKVESKITGDPAPCGNPMPEPDTQPNPNDPPVAEPLSTTEVTTIATWIDEGAKP
ncbi:MAG TPA: hypothetical protein VEK07_19045 [Polyangiaceae bacterium]|nr:hypothetical protein [Polyangiaceae bacterium]